MKQFVIIITVVLITIGTTHSVFAQSDMENAVNDKIMNIKAQALDDALTPSISATLTGLSLTGGTFLVNLARNNTENVTNHIHIARKSFIKAFYMFLICTIILFTFDFLEIIHEKYVIIYILIDVVMSYTFFGIGVFYLISAAKHLYRTYGKNIST